MRSHAKQRELLLQLENLVYLEQHRLATAASRLVLMGLSSLAQLHHCCRPRFPC